jgi:hypothetical protein
MNRMTIPRNISGPIIGGRLWVAFRLLAFLLLAGATSKGRGAEADTNDVSSATNTVPAAVTNSPAESKATNSTVTSAIAPREQFGDSHAEKSNEFKGQDLASFKIIADRNIFNMNRSPRSSGRRRVTEAPKPVRIDTFSLVGTLSSDKGHFAFFDGSNSDFQKVLKVDDSIGGCKIAQIDNSAVTLECKGKQIELKMGEQLRRQEEGEWQVSTQAESYSSSSSSSSSTTNQSEPSSGAESDILKRLMQQREQELNK